MKTSSATAAATNQPRFGVLGHYWALTKPRVTQLAVFCAVIGMCLASPGWPPLGRVVIAALGIWLLAAAAFAVNCLIEQRIDARMRRTAHRPLPQGRLTTTQTLVFSGGLGALGMGVLYYAVNPLTAWLTLATFVGYALIYTVLLKPRTSQNIVIGGLAGAMPPALGWAAIANTVPGEAWLLVLLIFVWTPPHFWALALYRRDDYAQAGLPMLPNTHGGAFTRLHILLYTVLLCGVSLLPFAVHMSGWIYLAAAVLLGGRFLYYAWRLYRLPVAEPSDAHANRSADALARATFRYSITYLSLLFAALLVDHGLR